jgi:hypothetical protein
LMLDYTPQAFGEIFCCCRIHWKMLEKCCS